MKSIVSLYLVFFLLLGCKLSTHSGKSNLRLEAQGDNFLCENIEGLKADTGKFERNLPKHIEYKILNPKDNDIVLKNGTIIEGSIDYGGIQPNYKISLSNPQIKYLIANLEEVYSNHSLDQNLEALRTLVRNKLKNRKYNSPPYVLMLSFFRENFDFPLVDIGEYLKIGSGVCREYAFISNIVLNHFKITSHLKYVTIKRRTKLGRWVVEDHAINVIEKGEKQYIFDPYFTVIDGAVYSVGEEINGVTINGELEYPRFAIPNAKTNTDHSQYIQKLIKSWRKIHLEDVTTLPTDFGSMIVKFYGRSSSKNKFVRESNSVEWLFVPSFGALGHSMLRVGNKLYQFSQDGWLESSPENANSRSAHEFIFNNKILKELYWTNKLYGVPPFVLGIPIESDDLEIEQTIEQLEDKKLQDMQFNLLMNNCNQTLVDILKKSGWKTLNHRFQNKSSSLNILQNIKNSFERGFSTFSSLVTYLRLLKHRLDNFAGKPHINAYVFLSDEFYSADPVNQLPNYLKPKHIFVKNSSSNEFRLSLRNEIARLTKIGKLNLMNKVCSI